MRLTGTAHISYAYLLHYCKCYRWKCVGNSTREFDMFVNTHHFMCICLTVAWLWSDTFFLGFKNNCKRESRGGALIVLIIEQLRLCSKLNSLSWKSWPAIMHRVTVMSCSDTDWPQRGAVTISNTVTWFLPEGTGGLTTSFNKEHSDMLHRQQVSDGRVCLDVSLLSRWLLFFSSYHYNCPFLSPYSSN